MWEFMAENIYDACACVQKWIAEGIMPNDRSFSVEENPERPGYYIAEEH